jgi:hypothetical protein
MDVLICSDLFGRYRCRLLGLSVKSQASYIGKFHGKYERSQYAVQVILRNELSRKCVGAVTGEPNNIPTGR